LEGNPKQRLQAKGQISFKQLAIDAPELFSAPLSPGDGRLDLDVSWQPQQWELSRVNLRSKDLQLALTGALRAADSEAPQLQLIVTAPSLAVAAVKSICRPVDRRGACRKLRGGPAVGNVKLNRAEITPVSDLRAQIAKGGFADAVSLDVEFRDIAANPAGGYPHFEVFRVKRS
jgi:hypothetical protein